MFRNLEFEIHSIIIAVVVFCLLILVCVRLQANEDLYAPVPDEMTVPNRTGIQCVYCSLEVLGNYLRIERLYNLTYRDDCKSWSDPGKVHRLLTSLNISFIQATNKRDGLKLIKHYNGYNLPVLIGVPHHAIVLVHYDENANRVAIIDNVGSRKPRHMSIEKFNSVWTGWVCAINPESPINHNVEVRMWYNNQ